MKLLAIVRVTEVCISARSDTITITLRLSRCMLLNCINKLPVSGHLLVGFQRSPYRVHDKAALVLFRLVIGGIVVD